MRKSGEMRWHTTTEHGRIITSIIGREGGCGSMWLDGGRTTIVQKRRTDVVVLWLGLGSLLGRVDRERHVKR